MPTDFSKQSLLQILKHDGRKFREVLLQGLLFVVFLAFLSSCEVDKGRIPIGQAIAGPIDIAFPNASLMYVANSNIFQDPFFDGSIGVYDISNPTEPVSINAVSTPVFNSRMLINTSLFPNRLYMSNRASVDDLDYSDPVYIFDTSDPELPILIGEFTTGDDPFGLAAAPAGDLMGRIFVPHISIGVVNSFEGNSPMPQDTFESVSLATFSNRGTSSSEIAISPDGAWGAVTNILSNAIYILDLTVPDENTLEAVLLIKNQGIFLNSSREVQWIDNNQFVFANQTLDGVVIVDLSVIDDGLPLPDDDEVEERVLDALGSSAVKTVFLPFYSDPYSMTRLGNDLYVTLYGLNQVARINLIAPTLQSLVLSGGDGPVAIRLGPDGRHLYVANQLSHTIGIIDTLDDSLVKMYPFDVPTNVPVEIPFP